MKILVCEKNEILLKTIEYKLNLDGHEVITAMDGRTASNIISSEKIDVLITDILVPFVTGLELVSLIRSKLQLDIPIIILSKIHKIDTIKQAYSLGVDEFITKPFDPDWLVVRIKQVVLNKSLNKNNGNTFLTKQNIQKTV